MHCEKCGAENQDNSLSCYKCNALIATNNSPLSGGERVKIISFFAFLILPLAWFGVSVLIVLIAITALYIMKKDQKFTPIIKAKKYIKAYLIVVGLFFTVMATVLFYMTNRYNSPIDNLPINPNIEIETVIFAIVALISARIAVAFFMFIFNKLFFKPLEEHKNWIIKNGIFSDEKNIKSDSTLIVGRDNLSSYSVADEMLKWNNMLEKGLISKEEFTKAKAKLMNGNRI